MKNNYNNFEKGAKKATQEYLYYSKVLKEPFSSIEELKEAEEAYYAKLRAKEDKALQKKTDAKKVEDAFITLNAARKTYKEDLATLTAEHSKKLIALNEAFKATHVEIKTALANAEDAYAAAIKEFTDKYPEGYHLTLKDGDFETTISGSHTTHSTNEKVATGAELFNWLFGL